MRDDVLSWATPPLASALTLTGAIALRLCVSTCSSHCSQLHSNCKVYDAFEDNP